MLIRAAVVDDSSHGFEFHLLLLLLLALGHDCNLQTMVLARDILGGQLP